MKELEAELEKLRNVYAMSTPAARHGLIQQRLNRAAAENGPARLITIVSAVEALARSLVVHAPGRPASSARIRYQQYRHEGPLELVAEVLRLKGEASGERYFPGDTWPLFELAIQYRNLVVHECTFLGQDKCPALILAVETVLRELVELCGLEPRLEPVS